MNCAWKINFNLEIIENVIVKNVNIMFFIIFIIIKCFIEHDIIFHIFFLTTNIINMTNCFFSDNNNLIITNKLYSHHINLRLFIICVKHLTHILSLNLFGN